MNLSLKLNDSWIGSKRKVLDQIKCHADFSKHDLVLIF